MEIQCVSHPRKTADLNYAPFNRSLGQEPLFVSAYPRHCLGFAATHFHDASRRSILDQALQFAEHNQQQGKGFSISKDLAHCLVQECLRYGDLAIGRQVQSLLANSNLDSVAFLVEPLIRLFASHGNLIDANRAFSKVVKPSQYTWNMVIDGHAKFGEMDITLQFHNSMSLEGTKPDVFTLPSILKACGNMGSVEQARRVHEQVLHNGFQSDIVVSNAMVHMYAKCGDLEVASGIFDRTPSRNMRTWGAMIAGYLQHGKVCVALNCFERMKQDGIKPSNATFSSVLKACGILGSLEQGRRIHELSIQNGILPDKIVGNVLVDMYAKCGCLEEAHKAFQNLLNRDVVSWNAMIAGYGQNGQVCFAFECFEAMQQGGTPPGKVTFLSILRICSSTRCIQRGRWIHEKVLDSGLHLNVIIRSSLVDMYSKCGNLEDAQRVFDESPIWDVVLWSTLIEGYVQHKASSIALECFGRMQAFGIKPDEVAFSSILNLCGNIYALERGRCIHVDILESSFQAGVMVGTALVDMYAKCGELQEACIAFGQMLNQNLLSWNAVLSGYVQLGEGFLAFKWFETMLYNGIRPDKVTFSTLLKGCGALEHGRCIHVQIIEARLQFDLVVASALIDMYAKGENLDEANRVFDGLPQKDVVVWNVLIAGYAQHGKGYLALKCFENMQHHGVLLDKFTYSSMLKACGSVGSLEQGTQVHEQIVEAECQSHVIVQNALVDMYVKCGSLNEACKAFDRVKNRDAVTWNTMIAGYAQHGFAGLAAQCFQEMQANAIRPNEMTFSAILTAFTCTGLVEEGIRYLKDMEVCHDLKPNIVHINCMIDLLGHAGFFYDVEDLLKITYDFDICLWTTLLSACKMHDNLELGKKCFDEIVRLEPNCDAAYVLMAGIYLNSFTSIQLYVRSQPELWLKKMQAPQSICGVI